MGINKHRLQYLEKKGLKSARLANKLIKQTDKLLSVILICNNFSNAAAASMVTVISIQLFNSDEEILLASTLIVTFLIVIFSEITPKVIAAAYSEKLALACSFILYPLLKVLYPIVLFINFFVLSILKVFNIKLNFNEKSLITMDELKSVISSSSKGITNKNQSMLINLIDLENDSVDDLMIPHTNVEFININQEVDEIFKKLKTYHHEFILVRSNDSQQITGLLNIRKLIKFIDDQDGITIDKIRDTAISHHRLFLVEVMGRDAGFIALNTGLAIGAQEILIPEVNMSIDNLINSLKRSKSAGKTSTIIVVAEGDKTGNNVFQLADTIEKKLPRYEVRVSVLGHMQRGGSPSCFDRVLGTQMGITAVESLINNEKGIMIGINNGKINKTELSKAIKGKTKINEELLRMSKIMNT